MRVLLGLLSYLTAAVMVVSGAAALVFAAVRPAVELVVAQQEPSKLAPRIQAWLDRKAEGLVYAERLRAAELAEKKEAEQFRKSIASTTAAQRAARARAAAAAQALVARAQERAERDATAPSDRPAAEMRWSANAVRMHGPE